MDEAEQGHASEAPGPADGLEAAAALELFLGLLGRTHLSSPPELAAVVAEQVEQVGARDARIYLIDYEQRRLMPLPGRPTAGISTLGWDGLHGAPGTRAAAYGGDADESRDEPVPIEGTMAGRCFISAEIVEAPGESAGQRRLWVPLVDGTERLGVFTILIPAGEHGPSETDLVVWERFAHLVAQLVVSKGGYGDAVEQVRRTKPMTVASELQWSLVPPLTFASPGLVIAAMLEPCYEDGGDAFDYAVNADVVHIAIIDAMGHGVAAVGTVAYTLAAYRRARRSGLHLPATYAAVDTELADLYGGERYATAVFAELDLHAGQLSWISAGHPAPLLLRQNRIVKHLAAPPQTPLGVPFAAGRVIVSTEMLQPGDRAVFYTDGLPEARQPDGSFFGLDRLVDFIERAGQDGYPAPETLRRLRHAVLQHQHGALQDDASALIVEWRRGSERALLPQTVNLDAPHR